jgi:hypothetical protein
MTSWTVTGDEIKVRIPVWEGAIIFDSQNGNQCVNGKVVTPFSAKQRTFRRHYTRGYRLLAANGKTQIENLEPLKALGFGSLRARVGREDDLLIRMPDLARKLNE